MSQTQSIKLSFLMQLKFTVYSIKMNIMNIIRFIQEIGFSSECRIQ